MAGAVRYNDDLLARDWATRSVLRGALLTAAAVVATAGGVSIASQGHASQFGQGVGITRSGFVPPSVDPRTRVCGTIVFPDDPEQAPSWLFSGVPEALVAQAPRAAPLVVGGQQPDQAQASLQSGVAPEPELPEVYRSAITRSLEQEQAPSLLRAGVEALPELPEVYRQAIVWPQPDLTQQPVLQSGVAPEPELPELYRRSIAVPEPPGAYQASWLWQGNTPGDVAPQQPSVACKLVPTPQEPVLQPPSVLRAGLPELFGSIGGFIVIPDELGTGYAWVSRGALPADVAPPAPPQTWPLVVAQQPGWFAPSILLGGLREAGLGLVGGFIVVPDPLDEVRSSLLVSGLREDAPPGVVGGFVCVEEPIDPPRSVLQAGLLGAELGQVGGFIVVPDEFGLGRAMLSAGVPPADVAPQVPPQATLVVKGQQPEQQPSIFRGGLREAGLGLVGGFVVIPDLIEETRPSILQGGLRENAPPGIVLGFVVVPDHPPEQRSWVFPGEVPTDVEPQPQPQLDFGVRWYSREETLRILRRGLEEKQRVERQERKRTVLTRTGPKPQTTDGKLALDALELAALGAFEQIRLQRPGMLIDELSEIEVAAIRRALILAEDELIILLATL